jgi:pyruvate, water dikinase
VDRKGDIVNAWLMCYPQPDCENALKLIGRLVVCARELDAVLGIDRDVEIFAKHFLAGNYDIFA